MPSPIAADDLRPDLWVTLRPMPEEDPPPDFLPGAAAEWLMRRRRRIGQRAGTPLRIIAVDLPYLYVSILDPDGDEVGPLILDIREQPVQRLDDSVPDAIRKFAGLKRLQSSRHREDVACRDAEVEAAAEAAASRRRRKEGLEPGPGDERSGESHVEAAIRRAVQKDVEAMRRRRLTRKTRRPDRSDGDG
ncbi:MAG: hypothetical protein RLZZ461_2075 [Planctomycetota bacterium]|jgi:hypothetical protein